MKFTCDQCSTRYSISDEKVEGKVLKIRCKVCEFTMVVRGTDSRVGGSLGSSMSVASVMMEPVYEIEWYAAPDGQQIGPVPIERIRAMIRSSIIKPQTVLWNENLENWTEARLIDALKSMFPAPAPKGPPPLPTVDKAPSLDLASSPGPLLPAQEMADRTMPTAAQLASAQQQTGKDDESGAPKAAPIRASDTLQYASPDVSEPGHSQSHGLLHSGQAAQLQSLTQDLGDPSEPDLTSMNSIQELELDSGMALQQKPTVAETEAYPLATHDQSIDDDRTELLDLEALIPMAEAAPVRDAETRKIERDDSASSAGLASSDGPSDKDSADEPPMSLAPLSDAVLADVRADKSESDSALVSDEVTIRRGDEGLIEPAAGPALRSLIGERVTHSFLDEPEEIDTPLVDAEAQLAEKQADAEPAGGAIHFGQPAERIGLGEPAKPAESSVGPPSAIPTERHERPKAKAQTSISPGLVVAACLIGMAGMFSVVFYFAKQKSSSKPSTPVAMTPKSQTPQEKTPPVALGATTKKVINPSAQAKPDPEKQVPAKPDAGLAKAKVNGTLPVETVRKRSVRKKVVKPRRTPKRSATVTQPVVKKTKNGRAGRTPDRPESRTLANFMTKRGGPSSSIRDPMIDARRAAAKKRVAKGLAQSVVSGVVSRYIRAMNGCYTRQLKQDPTYNPGRLTLRFQIRPTGRTAQLKIVKKNGQVLGNSMFLTKCLKQLVKRWSFPTFRGKAFETEFPIVFKSRL